MEEAVLEPTNTGEIFSAPVLFFTLADGKNLRSEQVLAKLQQALRERCPDCPPECVSFVDGEAVMRYFEEKNIEASQAVAVFDGTCGSGKCFSYLGRGKKGKPALFPSWSSGRWGVIVNPKVSEQRITSVALQLRADFQTHFLARLAEGKLPWGEAPSATDSKRERKERKEYRRKRRKKEERGYGIYGDIILAW